MENNVDVINSLVKLLLLSAIILAVYINHVVKNIKKYGKFSFFRPLPLVRADMNKREKIVIDINTFFRNCKYLIFKKRL